MTSTFYWAAAIGVAITIGVHLVIGGKLYVRALLAADIPDRMKWMAYMTWHIGTISFVVILAGFVSTALSPDRTEFALGATLLTSGYVATAVFAALKGKAPLKNFPVIFLFGIVSALGFAGLVL